MSWDLYRVFSCVAAEGSLSSASRVLKLSPPTISRRIQQLEEDLGARLFERSQDGYALTQRGVELVPLAEGMAGAAAAIDRKKPGFKETPGGSVRLAAGFWISRFILEHIADFRHHHPDVEIEILTGHKFASLSKHDADLAIRNIRPDSGRMTMRKLGRLTYAVYGSKGYVHSKPEALDGRRFHDCDWVGMPEDMKNLASVQWLYCRLLNPPVVRCTQTVHVLDAVKFGAGLAVLPHFVGDGDPSLVRVSETIRFPERDLWLVIHEDLKKAIPVRTFVDWLVPLFKSASARFRPD